MASEGRFVYNPSTVDISLSSWKMNNKWQGDVYHGDLNVVDVTAVMPGDRFKQDLSSFIRTATNPIAPIMDNIEVYFASYFVPKRLVFDKTKQFYGESVDGYGIAAEVLEPRDTSGLQTIYKGDSNKRCLAAQLGLVRQKETPTTPTPIALNPIRAVLQCYNDWYRNENFMAPYLWNHSETGDAPFTLATRNGSNINASTLTTDSVVGSLPKVCKKLDRYTSCLPWAQKAVSAVLLPLGESAPIRTTNSFEYVDSGVPAIKFRYSSNGTVPSSGFLALDSNGNTSQSSGSPTLNGNLYPTNLYADLSQATAATINQLRMAFATQRYFEALARTGSKYREYIKGIFGVNIGDTTAQMAEYLGGYWYHLNVDQVLQSTGYAPGSTSTLGAPGAVSVSGQSDFMYHKGFVEPGYVVTLMWTKHDRTYGQGIDDIFLKHELFDEYNPKFANIGEQALKKGFLFFSGEKNDDEQEFGFQEAWSEYRFKKDVVVGNLAPSNSGSYNYWNLAENFAAAPSLNEAFLTENRDNIIRCLAGGASSPDYFVDLYFDRIVARPMPVYSIPGLIDHH